MHRGAQVLAYTAEEALDLFELISVLESLAAERLARRIPKGVMMRLEALHSRMLEQFDDRDASTYFDTTTEIHETIVSAAGNPVLSDSHKRVMARTKRGRFLAIFDRDRLQRSVNEHEALMQACRSRDPIKAAQVWRTHLGNTGATVATVLRGASAHHGPEVASGLTE